MSIAGNIATGWVVHRRHDAVGHAFRVPLWMLEIDLERAPALLGGSPWLGIGRPGLLRVLRRDVLDGGVAGIRDRARRSGIADCAGPVRMLTVPRHLGLGFNPVSFYLLHRADGRVAGLSAEITNTPWGERHAYTLPAGAGTMSWSFPKVFHVSPFQPLAQAWSWRVRWTADRILIRMDNHGADDGRHAFTAVLALRLTPLTAHRLAATALLRPFMGLRALLRIYREAALLWWKRAPFFPHPAKVIA